VGHDSDAQFVTAGVNFAFGGTRERSPVIVSGPVSDSTTGGDQSVSPVDEGVAVFDEELVGDDEVSSAGNDLIAGDDLPAVSDDENTDAAYRCLSCRL